MALPEELLLSPSVWDSVPHTLQGHAEEVQSAIARTRQSWRASVTFTTNTVFSVMSATREGQTCVSSGDKSQGRQLKSRRTLVNGTARLMDATAVPHGK
jgi:hypothetical protein